MGKRIPDEVCGVAFKSRLELSNYVRNILYKYDIGDTLDRVDSEFIYDLLLRHPQSDKKIGAGVSQFIVDRQKKVGKNRCFYIIRSNGCKTDFSFKDCIKNKNPHTKFSSVCRRVISSQVREYKQKSFKDRINIHCPISNILLDYNNSHVDHKYPNTFDSIVSKFMQEFNIELEDVKYIERDNQIGAIFADEGLKNAFYKFHKENANLQIISTKVNLTLSKSPPSPRYPTCNKSKDFL